MATRETAQRVIDAAREAKGGDAFDFYTAAHGIEPYGPLYNEVFIIANPRNRAAGEGERKARAQKLWQKVLPELRAYEDLCKRSTYTGWSPASKGPIRRHDPKPLA